MMGVSGKVVFFRILFLDFQALYMGFFRG